MNAGFTEAIAVRRCNLLQKSWGYGHVIGDGDAFNHFVPLYCWRLEPAEAADRPILRELIYTVERLIRVRFDVVRGRQTLPAPLQQRANTGNQMQQLGRGNCASS